MSSGEDLAMCGILGGVNTDFDERSLDRLVHRGPDQRSFITLEAAGGGTITLGQTRLNVVDRHDIDLPVRIGEAVILFNGEIYNHPELRSELEAIGWTFRTSTDTEVALASYLQWGPDCLSRFNGMFALVVWDGRRFFCARDRMGEKPLFYRCRGGAFEFASEIKAFSDLQFTTHELFDLFEFCFNEHTLYRDIFALPPGQYLMYDVARGACHTRCYWDIEHQLGNRITSEKTAVDYLIKINGKRLMAIKCSPGALESRERHLISFARVVDDYQIPYALVTDGSQARLLDTLTGKLVSEGLISIPEKGQAGEMVETAKFIPYPPERMEKERRILLAFEAIKCTEESCE